MAQQARFYFMTCYFILILTRQSEAYHRKNEYLCFSVHEYGGGVYLPLSDGSVVYSTVEGMWIQSSATGRPGQMANAVDKKFR